MSEEGAVVKTTLFSQSYIHTDVVCLRLINDLIFAGIGGCLFVYNYNRELQHLQIFTDQKIHGTIYKKDFEEHVIGVYGGKSIAFVSCDIKRKENIHLSIIHSFQVNDWVQDAVILNEEHLIFTTAHNTTEMWDRKSCELIQRVECEEKCILYSATILGNTSSNLVILAGTVFSEVIIWSPKFNVKDKTSNVMHRLKGHKGVIFSIAFSNELRLISTTSDDRSLRLWSVRTSVPEKSPLIAENWEQVDICLVHTLFTHTARVWRSFFMNNEIVSIGEDSKLCLWSTEGKLLKCWKTHQNGGIWAADYSVKEGIIITGGSDGGISLWSYSYWMNVKNSMLLPIQKDLWKEDVKIIPRKVTMLNSKIFTLIDDGTLISFNKKTDKWCREYHNMNLKNYYLMNSSCCQTMLALSSMDGNVTIYKQKEDLNIVSNLQINGGKILSLHWFDDGFMTCGTGGKLILWKLNSDYTLNKIHSFVLPNSKERWTTCLLKRNDEYILGDRMGSLFLFSGTSKTDLPIQTLLKIHGYLGVSDIKLVKEDIIFTTGRDGTVKKFYYSRSSLEFLSEIRLPFDWGSKILTTELGILILGFSETLFTVWSLNQRESLLEIPCGGGHRSWDFNISDGTFDLVFIKDKQISCISHDLKKLNSPCLRVGFHPREINCIKVIYNDTLQFVSASEDTTVKICEFKNELIQLYTLQSHISSVRAISLCSIGKDYFIFTAGGRGQVVVWKLNEECRELCQHMLKDDRKKIAWKHLTPAVDPQTRYMYLSSVNVSENKILLAGGCSDGFVRILLFDLIHPHLYCVGSLFHTSNCVLGVHTFWYDNFLITLSMNTTGFVLFWNISDMVKNSCVEEEADSVEIPFGIFSLHQSGINSFDFVKLDENHYLLGTGGDDNCVILSIFEIVKEDQLSVSTISQWKSSLLHSCQVTGLRFVSDKLVTTSIDQRITALSWKVNQNYEISVDFIDQYCSSVSDIQGLEVFRKDKDVYSLCVFGKGIEIIDAKLDAKTTPV